MSTKNYYTCVFLYCLASYSSLAGGLRDEESLCFDFFFLGGGVEERLRESESAFWILSERGDEGEVDTFFLDLFEFL